MNYIEGKARYYLLLLTSDFYLIDRITQNEILSYRTVRTCYLFMQLITLIIFIIVGTHHTLHHTYSPSYSVTSYNLQHVFVSRDKWEFCRTCGHAEIQHHCNHRRRHHSQIIFLIKRKKTIDRSKPCGDCVASHPIKETTREIRDGTYCK